jgi:Co/Zn/Cd efflux system component
LILLVLGLGVLGEAIYRGLLQTSPQTGIMLTVAGLSLAVNSTVLYQLGKFRRRAVHMRATWIFTRADVIANAAVILSALVISLTRLNFVDAIVGAGIGLYVCKEAWEILREARKALPAQV